jgi:hypothetical protein
MLIVKLANILSVNLNDDFRDVLLDSELLEDVVATGSVRRDVFGQNELRNVFGLGRLRWFGGKANRFGDLFVTIV